MKKPLRSFFSREKLEEEAGSFLWTTQSTQELKHNDKKR